MRDKEIKSGLIIRGIGIELSNIKNSEVSSKKDFMFSHLQLIGNLDKKELFFQAQSPNPKLNGTIDHLTIESLSDSYIKKEVEDFVEKLFSH